MATAIGKILGATPAESKQSLVATVSASSLKAKQQSTRDGAKESKPYRGFVTSFDVDSENSDEEAARAVLSDVFNIQTVYAEKVGSWRRRYGVLGLDGYLSLYRDTEIPSKPENPTEYRFHKAPVETVNLLVCRDCRLQDPSSSAGMVLLLTDCTDGRGAPDEALGYRLCLKNRQLADTWVASINDVRQHVAGRF